MSVSIPPATSPAALDAAVARVKEHSARFARLSIAERIHLVREMQEGFYRIREGAARAACEAKGIDWDSPLAGEEWFLGPVITLRILRTTLDSLEEIQRFGAPRVKRAWQRTLPDGRLAIHVYPTTALDGMILPGSSAEAWMAPEIGADNLAQHQASFYRRPHGGRLCAVLGGGNVNAIPAGDVLNKLFVEGACCVLKMNPVNAYLGPFLERGFAAAIRDGYLAVLYGGAEEGRRLLEHPGVDEVHVTGSDQTYDAMVWGPPGEERELRRREGRPLLNKPVSAELGNITPVVIVPGPVSRGAFGAQLEGLAGMFAHNASFNCVAAKLLVTQQGWAGRESMLEGLQAAIARAPARVPYYPGAEERWRRLTAGRQGLRLIGEARAGTLPWALVPGLSSADAGEPLFAREPWCGVLAEASVPAGSAVEFLERSVEFLNQRVWGSLCAALIVHPASLLDPEVSAAFQRALSALRYGTVCVNTWPGAAFGLGTLPWGGYPGATPRDIQSGVGWVHNPLMLEGVEKVVMRGPFKPVPRAIWSPGHRTLKGLGAGLAEQERHPSWWRMAGLAWRALGA